MRRLLLCTAITFSAQVALAQAPRVSVDIAPVHSLVAQVMEGVGQPDLILPPNASPHHYSLRPSEARALNEADLVVWVGPSLTPWLERSIEGLAASAKHIALLDLAQTQRLEFRENARFAPHDHGDDHDEDHSGDHEGDHEGETHGTKESHDDDHSEEHEEHEEHHAVDPHAWLDPQNAAVWVETIAHALAEVDPVNSSVYLQNATAAVDNLERLQAEIETQLAAATGNGFVVYHDAFHYFERRFEIEAQGAIELADTSAPSAKRLREIQMMMSETGANCVLAEPQANPKLVATVAGDARVVRADVTGSTLALGPHAYEEMLRGVSAAILECNAP